ncbi:hypothetical protein ACSFA2_25170 [Variovorax sp. LT2P21]|uniref:hypothetical protein n=1 Tax=Variovorax sp. LT2P21 TaxID=3443731 RepID=UPI003F47CF5C
MTSIDAVVQEATFRVRVALQAPFAAAEVARYLLVPEVLRYWLDGDSWLQAEVGSTVSLPVAEADSSRRIRYRGSVGGRVQSLAWPAAASHADAEAGTVYELAVALDASDAVVTFRFSTCAEGTCRIRIDHSGLKSELEQHASVRVWQAALNRVNRLMSKAQWARRHERQAVIVVHGIGEQRPGQMLRQFVGNIFEDSGKEPHFVKPDLVSSLFEMHMATVPRIDGRRPTTDVYELYWAHLIRDTTAAQVYGWLLRLLFSRDATIPRTLIRLVWVFRVALGIAVVFAVWLMNQDIDAWLKGFGIGLLAALPAIAKFAFAKLRDEFILGYAGDAARYLEPRADNIARRQAIREAGAKLIEALHDKGRYSRIMVYGHSLGSVIAYDILSHAWARRSRSRNPVEHTNSSALEHLENLLNPRGVPDEMTSVDAVQPLQHAAWQEYQRNGFQWKVSDFVTAGSPLAHGSWLLKLDADTTFSDLVRERSFPTCPPQTEPVASPVPGQIRKAFTFTHAYDNADNPKSKRSVQVPHHGGLFALTRWTNLYFPYRGLYDGDPVGGPVAEWFGSWVKDVRLRDTKGFAHTRYTSRNLEHDAVIQVRSALNLPLERPLADYAPHGLHPTVLN